MTASEGRPTLRYNFYSANKDPFIDGTECTYDIRNKNTILIMQITSKRFSEVLRESANLQSRRAAPWLSQPLMWQSNSSVLPTSLAGDIGATTAVICWQRNSACARGGWLTLANSSQALNVS